MDIQEVLNISLRNFEIDRKTTLLLYKTVNLKMSKCAFIILLEPI